MFSSRIIVIVLLVLAMWLFGIPAAAQTPMASPQATPQSGAPAGLLESVARQYSSDPELIPADNPEVLLNMSARIFRFDSDDHAAAAWESLRDNAARQLQPAAGAGLEAIEVNEETIGDLGDQAGVAWLSASPEENVTGYFRLVYVQDGDLLYVITAIAGNEEITHLADDLARTMAERDISDEPVNFNADGGSTGGLWEKFPPADEAPVQDIVAFRDAQSTAP